MTTGAMNRTVVLRTAVIAVVVACVVMLMAWLTNNSSSAHRSSILRVAPSAAVANGRATVVPGPMPPAVGAAAPPPTCPLPTSPSPASVTVSLKNSPVGFGLPCYDVAAHKAFTLTLVNGITYVDMTGTSTGQTVPAQLIISPASSPAIVARPGQPGGSTGEYAKASYLGPEVSSNAPSTASVGPLPAGTYVLQLAGVLGAEATPATLIIN